MRVCNLASGSKGNCTYFETESAKILIDAGLSATELGKRLSMLGVTLGEIDAVIVTHEHIDHIKALSTLANKYGIKIYAHVDEWQAINCKQKINPTRQMAFFDDAFNIFDATITPIRLSHDSHTCFGYTVENSGKKFSILTDLGQTNDRILSAVSGSLLVYLEANHDEDMLRANPNYPQALKQRILSSRGHLSNTACAKAIERLLPHGVKQIVLSHLSENNNTPDLAYSTICSYLGQRGLVEGQHIYISIAKQERPTSIFNLK